MDKRNNVLREEFVGIAPNLTPAQETQLYEEKQKIGQQFELGTYKRKLDLQFQTDQENIARLPVMQQLKERGAPVSVVEAIMASAASDALRDEVVKELKTIPKEKLKAIGIAIKTNAFGGLLNDPKTQRLKTALEMYIQSTVREFQGGRPSDKDRELIGNAIGNIASGQLAFDAGMKKMESIIKSRRESMYRTAKTSFAVDISGIDGFQTMTGKNMFSQIAVVNGEKQIDTKNKLVMLDDGETITFDEAKRRGLKW
jgi:hypothetical protein